MMSHAVEAEGTAGHAAHWVVAECWWSGKLACRQLSLRRKTVYSKMAVHHTASQARRLCRARTFDHATLSKWRATRVHAERRRLSRSTFNRRGSLKLVLRKVSVRFFRERPWAWRGKHFVLGWGARSRRNAKDWCPKDLQKGETRTEPAQDQACCYLERGTRN